MNKQLNVWFRVIFGCSCISQAEFSRRHKLSRSLVSVVLNGQKNISLRTFERVAKREGFVVHWRLDLL